jgi:catechol 2,3-dioxygenase-like lactoylglutathione lyase family enzyme
VKPRVSFITLGVDDLNRSLAFYRDGMHLPTVGIIGQEFGPDAQVVFFKMNVGLILALWPRTSLANHAGVANGAPNPAEFALAHNVGSQAEVDVILAEAKAAGARMMAPAKDQPWGGYSGYFQDPDGHLWEVAWSPHFGPVGD